MRNIANVLMRMRDAHAWTGLAFPALSCRIKGSITWILCLCCLWERGRITSLWYLLTHVFSQGPCHRGPSAAMHHTVRYFWALALTETTAVDGRDDEMLGNRSGPASSANSWQLASSPLITTTHSVPCSSSAKGEVGWHVPKVNVSWTPRNHKQPDI